MLFGKQKWSNFWRIFGESLFNIIYFFFFSLNCKHTITKGRHFEGSFYYFWNRSLLNNFVIVLRLPCWNSLRCLKFYVCLKDNSIFFSSKRFSTLFTFCLCRLPRKARNPNTPGSLKLHKSDIFVSFDDTFLYNDIPIENTLSFIGTKLRRDGAYVAEFRLWST